MRHAYLKTLFAVLVAVLLVGTLTTVPAQAVTQSWGHIYLGADNGWRQAEAYGTAGWDGQPWVRARYRDYNGYSDNDHVFVQVKFYKYESWVCGINGSMCYGYRLKATKETSMNYGVYAWKSEEVRLGHSASGRWSVRARVCDRDAKTGHVDCSPWTRSMQVH